MRAAGLLVTFASMDIALVAVAGLAQPEGFDIEAVRIPLGGIVAVTALGLVALAVLSFAARWLGRLRADVLRKLGGFALGGAYGAAIIGFVAWAALWLSPDFAPVALAGLACAGLLSWQSWAEAEMGEVERLRATGARSTERPDRMSGQGDPKLGCLAMDGSVESHQRGL